MDFTEHQRLFLQAACDYFHTNGGWPTYRILDKTLRPHRGLDVVTVGNELASFIQDTDTISITFAWNPDQIVKLHVSAIYECFLQGICPKLGDDLSAFIRLVKESVKRYEDEQEEVPVMSDQFDGHSDLNINAFSNAFRLVESDGFFSSASIDEGGQAPDHTRVLHWEFTAPHDVRKYRDVETIEDYLAVRKVVKKGVREFLLPDSAFDGETGEFNQEAFFAAIEPVLEDVSRTLDDSAAEHPPPKAFVSHSHVDNTFAEPLVKDLKAAGADYPHLRQLVEGLKALTPGRGDATAYHRTVFELLQFVFDFALQNFEIEQEMDQGRGRIDIICDNFASDGFFADVKVQLNANSIPIECKNFGADLGNNEFNQISDRLSDTTSQLGLLFCRTVADKKSMSRHATDRYLRQGHKVILLFSDEDLVHLVRMRLESNYGGIEALLRKRRRFVEYGGTPC